MGTLPKSSNWTQESRIRLRRRNQRSSRPAGQVGSFALKVPRQAIAAATAAAPATPALLPFRPVIARQMTAASPGVNRAGTKLRTGQAVCASAVHCERHRQPGSSAAWQKQLSGDQDSPHIPRFPGSCAGPLQGAPQSLSPSNPSWSGCLATLTWVASHINPITTK